MTLDLSALKITDTQQGCTFAVKVVPVSSRNRIVGTLGQALKVTLVAAPEKGAANKALLKILAEHFKLPRARLKISSGHSQQRKIILALDCPSDQLRRQ